jgi:hypothetical protein
VVEGGAREGAKEAGVEMIWKGSQGRRPCAADPLILLMSADDDFLMPKLRFGKKDEAE